MQHQMSQTFPINNDYFSMYVSQLLLLVRAFMVPACMHCSQFLALQNSITKLTLMYLTLMKNQLFWTLPMNNLYCGTYASQLLLLSACVLRACVRVSQFLRGSPRPCHAKCAPAQIARSARAAGSDQREETGLWQFGRPAVGSFSCSTERPFDARNTVTPQFH